MHVRVRVIGAEAREVVVSLPSRLSRVETLRAKVQEKFSIAPRLQRLFYGGKLLEDSYTFHDYNIKLNDVIQLIPRRPDDEDKGEAISEASKSDGEAENQLQFEESKSDIYRVGDLIDVKLDGSWLEGKIIKILRIVEELSKESQFKSPSKLSNGTSKSPAKHTNGTPKSPGNSKSNKTNDESLDSETFKSTSSTRARKAKESPTSASKGKKSKTPDTTPKKGSIHDYFGKSPKSVEKNSLIKISREIEKEESLEDIIKREDKVLLFKIQLYDDEIVVESKVSQIRPRARKELKMEELYINQIVMLNYNLEETHEIGFWYDFIIHELKPMRKSFEIYGAIKQGSDILINDTKVKTSEKIYDIETAIPLRDRTKAYEKLMLTETEKRKRPYHCSKCKDIVGAKCRDCGCTVCAGKNQPDKIILCDECNTGYHLFCLEPVLDKLPAEDWYCPNCRRNPEDVIAPGKAKQLHKANRSKTKRDWGRGMACVGKTQTCSMPANHFGPIPGIEVGMAWRFRIQLSESGVHRPPVSGIHGRDVDGAYSIVLSGGYEDDTDDGFEFTYTGSGGRDLSGNRRTADQSSDQTLTRENRALAKNCAVKEISEDGADAGENWRDGKPVRVTRSYKMKKHFPAYAPKEGIRYDGIYKVVKYYPETGKSGFRVWKYMLRRDDPNPTPWDENAKKFTIVYPDGYLEAEAEKLSIKQKNKSQKRKRVLKESNGVNVDEDENKKSKSKKNNNSSKDIECDSPPKKKMRTRSMLNDDSEKQENKKKLVTPKRKRKSEAVSPNSVNPFTIAAKKSDSKDFTQNENVEPEILSTHIETVKKDELNKKLWDECLVALKHEGKQGLINKVTTLFLCIICQDLAASPATTSCGHNFCTGCLKLAFKSTEGKQCPYCRTDLSKEEMNLNEALQTALRAVMPGYDAGRK